jgi:heat shock protein HspQ
VNKRAKFNIGDVVIHSTQGYRAVIIDVDPIFQASGRLNPQSMKREFAKRNPWYRVLVDDSSYIAYVEEIYLKTDPCRPETINNPNVERYLVQNKAGYRSNVLCH